MSFKALLTMLVLGSSSVALAHPGHQDQLSHVPSADVMRARIRMMAPVTLATNVNFTRYWNRDQRPLKIDVDHRAGGFRKLRLDRDAGAMHIDSIVVMLANGRSQTYTIDQRLNGRHPSLTIDLHGQRITGIYVYGTSMRGRASFDVIGLRR